MTTRREFLMAMAATSLAPSLRAQAAHINVGLELYSFRDAIKRDLPGTLAKARAMGFDHVETGSDFYGQSAAEFKKTLDTAGLRATSFHFQYDQFKEIDKVRSVLDVFGARWACLAWIPHKDQFAASDAQRAIDDFNSWGPALAKSGHGFGYHAHGYEFGWGNGKPIDVRETLFHKIVSSTDPATVKFEMDTFWIVVPGQSCEHLLQTYPGRWRLMHLKDLRKGAPIGNQQGRAKDEDSVSVGSGVIDWNRVLRLAREQGMQDYFLEDESPAALEQAPVSLKYLNGRSW